jgi:hypothetical protein
MLFFIFVSKIEEFDQISVFIFLGVKLHNTLSYAVFVRIWYSSNHYAVFKSNGIVVMGQAPALATKRGKTVCIPLFGL